MAQLIILRGYPGSGKTTIGKKLEEQGVGTFIDHNAILTFIATISGDDDEIYDDIANLEKAITRKLLKSGKTVIVARGFGSPSSIDSYVNIANNLDLETKVIRLNVAHDKLIERVQSPERKMDFNPTTDAGSLNHWIKENPIIDYPGEIAIDNLESVDRVVSSVVTQI